MAIKKWPKIEVEQLISDGVLAINDGYRVRNIELGPTGIPFVRGGDIGDGSISTTVKDHIRAEYAERVRAKLTRPFDVAFISKGTVGRVGILRPDQPQSVFAPQVCYWRSLDTKRLVPRFLFYILRSHEFQDNLNAVKTHGSMVADYVSMTDQRRFKLTLPPYKEQVAIANALGVLDDKIELNRRMNTTLEAMARALFQSWFVDFDPVRAKRDGRQPPNLDPATAALFPDQVHNSFVGPIPNGWTIEPVGEVVDCVGGGTPSTAVPEYWEGGTHHWATPKDFSSLRAPILLDTDRKLTDAGIAKISSGLLPAGTLLLSSRAPVGYLAIAAMPVAINQGFIALKCNARASNFFMLNWCQSNMAEIESRATGTTFAEISKQNFHPIRVVLPQKELMVAFTAKVAPLYAQITDNIRQSRTLAALRDTLLPKLLSGELPFIANRRNHE
jgi:type I restriction enzyme S subunit